MKNYYKVVAYDIFQFLIIFSIPFILCFYWPQHDGRLMKLLAFQIYVNILLCLSFIFTPKRTIENVWPGILFLSGFLNLFTHSMSNDVNIGLSFILPSVTAIYVLSNHINQEIMSKIKKVIVITCLVNCLLFIIEYFRVTLIFNMDMPYERASGFMCYPVGFSLLCAISLFLAWDWNRWLCIPIALCMILAQEFSVISIFTIVVLSGMFRKSIMCIILALIVCLGFLWVKDSALIDKHIPSFLIKGGNTYDITSKFENRVKFIYPILENISARPLDGWGVGVYNRLPQSFFGFNRGNWSEMHCEPLDLFFSMGLIGLAVVGGWIYDFRRKFEWNSLSKFIVIAGFTSLFHSILHFADTLWLCIVVISIYYVERDDRDDIPKQC